MTKKYITSLLLAAAATILFVGRAHAVSSTIDPSSLPGSGLTGDALLEKIINDVLVGLAIVAFLGMVYGGIMYITAGGDAAKALKARQSILYSLIGVIVVALSWGIINYVVTSVSTLTVK